MSPDIHVQATSVRARLRLRLRLCAIVATCMLSWSVRVSVGINIKSTDYSAEQIWTHVKEPIAVRAAPDNSVFVGTKAGVVWRFDSINDPTGRVILDINKQVYDYWDCGLLGLAIHPEFPALPYYYILYTADSDANAPLLPPKFGDTCADGSGLCQTSIALSRVDLDGNEVVMFHGNCHSSPSHNAGDVFFIPGEDPPALYVALGDGAHFDYIDTGQTDTCGINPGGAFRAQDGSHVYGSLLRVDPLTGEGMPDNPVDPAVSDRRVFAHGLRNPYRSGVDTYNGKNDIYIGDVGWATWEEINVLPQRPKTVMNFGWPCYEGKVRNDPYALLNSPACTALLSNGKDTKPWFVYSHHQVSLASGDTGCSHPGESSVTGMAVNNPLRGGIEDATAGAVFFGDFARYCMWYFPRKSDGTVSTTPTFFAKGVAVTDIVFHAGRLLVSEVMQNRIWSITNTKVTAQPPRAILTASSAFGMAPMTVTFDGSQSFGPANLQYAWSSGSTAYSAMGKTMAQTFTTPGTYTVTLTVSSGNTKSTASVKVVVAGTYSLAVSLPKKSSDRWRVGDVVNVAATASCENVPVATSALKMTVKMRHCMYDGCSLGFGTCHEHLIEELDLATKTSFRVPQHEYPSTISLQLVATFVVGGSTVVQTQDFEFVPRVAQLVVRSDPPGLTLLVSNRNVVTPSEVHSLANGYVNIVALDNQRLGALTYTFVQWSDGSSVPSRSLAMPTDIGRVEITAVYKTTIVNAVDIVTPVCPRNYGGV